MYLIYRLIWIIKPKKILEKLILGIDKKFVDKFSCQGILEGKSYRNIFGSCNNFRLIGKGRN